MTGMTPNYQIRYPEPTDLIKDPNVSSKLANDMRDGFLDVDNALAAEIEPLNEQMKSSLRFVRNLNTGEDLNAILEPGIYGIPSTTVSSGILNNPLAWGVASRGNVVVTGPTSGNRQQAVYGSGGQCLYRNTMSGGGFSDWYPLDGIGSPVPENIVMQEFRVPGTHYVGSSTWASTISGRPPINPAPAVVLQFGHNGGPSTQRLWMDQTGQGIWFQRLYSGWQPWEPLGGGSSSGFDVTKGHYGSPNQLRLEAFKEKYPLVSTGGKGAVVVRWDHGLTNFKSDLLPLHEQFNIPGIIAMNSRNWGHAENVGMSKSEAAALAAGTLIEWGNHGADGAPEGQPHKDDPTKDGLWDQIVVGRKELETDLGIAVHAYLRPGTDGTQGGLGNISTLDQLTETYAGALVLGHHAVTSGYFPNSASRVLDGRIKQGQAHWNMEQQTVASAKAQIDNAISAKRCLCIMGHPRNLNKPGYYTTADVQEIFAYINTKIQEGSLARISPLQSLHASL